MRLLCVALLAGCAMATPNYKQPFTARAPEGVADEDLYAATVRTLTDRGFSLRDKDKDAGMVTTEWVVVFTNPISSSEQTLHSWRAIIREGEVRLHVDCESIGQNTGRTSCNSSEYRQESFIRDVDGLKRAIMTEAQARAEKRKAAPGPAAPEQAAAE
ncbi:MAG TPA: hypothetical protein VEA41_10140 [Salinarimonas sp.]|nr:hypothetical protein [Salinarimonas sp.]